MALISVDGVAVLGAGEHVFLIAGTLARRHHVADPLLLVLCSVLHVQFTSILLCHTHDKYKPVDLIIVISTKFLLKVTFLWYPKSLQKYDNLREMKKKKLSTCVAFGTRVRWVTVKGQCLVRLDFVCVVLGSLWC